MPTKRTASAIPASPLDASPALTLFLMLGTPTTTWLPGWVLVEQFLMVHAGDFEALRRAAWPSLAARLIAEARAHGFEPWAKTGRRPRGHAVKAWIDQQVAKNGRPRD